MMKVNELQSDDHKQTFIQHSRLLLIIEIFITFIL